MGKAIRTGCVLLILACMISCRTGRIYASGGTAAESGVSEETADSRGSQEEGKKNCWIKENGRIYRIGENGKRYTKTGFRKIEGKKYYFKKDHSAAVGYTKIKKKYYLFSKKGVLVTKDRKVDGVKYYIKDKKTVEAYKSGGKYYYPSGKKMSKLDAYDYDTYQTARKIAADITTRKMSKAQKLKKVFKWVMKKSYITKRKFTTKPGWIPLYANDHFHGKGSTCQGDAAAFAYLAKAVGYKKVYVCMDSPRPGGHAWTEIDGKAYDPLFAQNRGFYKHYAIEYGKVFRLRPKVHIRIS
ncbi:MAG: hypothetical protein IJJ25_06935 [Lachnospiraceae bacterium]|nr:hypothetical protein [Lachnospiraceae bacterium]